MTPLPRIIAHRGAKSLAPENTIAAFAKAMPVRPAPHRAAADW